MDATPSVALPGGAGSGIAPRGRRRRCASAVRRSSWGERTFVMGIINVTPDSFSGDGLLQRQRRRDRALLSRRSRMAAEGADMLDMGGQSTRPGHREIAVAEEQRRVLPVVRAIREALPDMPISIDTTRAEVAAPALDAGAELVNDVWGSRPATDLLRLAAARGVPLVLMHNRVEPRYRNVVAEVRGRSVAGDRPGGRGGRRLGAADRRPGHRLWQDSRPEPRRPARPSAAALARPARPAGHQPQVDHRQGARSCAGRAPRGDAGYNGAGHRRGRRHRPRPRRRANVRVARMADAIVRHGSRRRSVAMSDAIFLRGMAFEGRHGVTEAERAEPQLIEIDVDCSIWISRRAGASDDAGRDGRLRRRSSRSAGRRSRNAATGCSRRSPRRAHGAAAGAISARRACGGRGAQAGRADRRGVRARSG